VKIVASVLLWLAALPFCAVPARSGSLVVHSETTTSDRIDIDSPHVLFSYLADHHRPILVRQGFAGPVQHEKSTEEEREEEKDPGPDTAPCVSADPDNHNDRAFQLRAGYGSLPAPARSPLLRC
jgi:hypothetical protein